MNQRPHELSPFQQRLLAEAVRVGDERAGRAGDDARAAAVGRAAGGSQEQRIIARALALPQASKLARAIDRHRRGFRFVVITVLLLALLAGITSARLTLGSGAQVNILWALGALLGVQLVLLVVWLVLMLIPVSKDAAPRGSALGRGVIKLGRWLSRDAGTGQVALATAQVMGHGRLGRWLIGAVGHGIWFAYTLGALAACVVLLAIHQYDFYWATTIVPDSAMVNLLSVLAWLPGALGIPVPDAELIRASRLGAGEGIGRQPWSGLLTGSLLLLGLAPRGLLGLLCAWRVRRATRRYRLDLTRPGFARLIPRLQPVAKPLGRLGEPPPELAVAEPAPIEPLNIEGLIAMAGVELERAGADWPPIIDGVDWIVLGRADDRAGQRDVLAALSALAAPPGLLVVLVSLLRTPDRGTGAFLTQLKDTAAAPVMLLLDEGELLKQRGGDLASRIAAWRALAAGADIALAEAFDLDAPDAREKLKQRLGLDHG